MDLCDVDDVYADGGRKPPDNNNDQIKSLHASRWKERNVHGVEGDKPRYFLVLEARHDRPQGSSTSSNPLDLIRWLEGAEIEIELTFDTQERMRGAHFDRHRICPVFRRC